MIYLFKLAYWLIFFRWPVSQPKHIHSWGSWETMKETVYSDSITTMQRRNCEGCGLADSIAVHDRFINNNP